MRTKLLITPMLAFITLIGACGFHMRGKEDMQFPFKTLFIQAPGKNTPFLIDLKQGVSMYGISLSDSSENAQLTLLIVSETPSKQILSLSEAGRVSEYQLNYRVSFRAYDSKQQDWVAADEIVLQRYLSYNNALILAKEAEEAILYKDLRTDAVTQILRRLSRAKPPQPPQ